MPRRRRIKRSKSRGLRGLSVLSCKTVKVGKKRRQVCLVKHSKSGRLSVKSRRQLMRLRKRRK